MAEGSISRAYKVELRPTVEQAEAFAQWAGVRRFCWNRGVGMLHDQLAAWRQAVDAFAIARGLDPKETRKNWRANKQELLDAGLVLPKPAKINVYKVTSDDRDGGKAWLRDAPATIRSQADREFRDVLSRYYAGKIRRPRFQSRYGRRPSFSLQVQTAKPFDGDAIIVTIPKGAPKSLARVRTWEPVEDIVKGRVTKFTISRDVDRWYCAITVVDCPRPDPTEKTHARGGVDLNTHSIVFAHEHGHEVFEIPPQLAKVARQIKHVQRELARRRPKPGEKASENYKKTRLRLGKLHRKQRRIRTDWLHQITHRLATTCARVTIEDLNVRGMTRSAKGTVGDPGKRVAQKSGLNRAILNACFSEFRRQLEYKGDWYGCEVMMADRFYPSSKRCSSCGTVKAELRLGQRTYTCESCGLSIDRDLNAALNLRDYESSSASADEGPRGTGSLKPVERNKALRRRKTSTATGRCEAGTLDAQGGQREIPARQKARKTGVSLHPTPRAALITQTAVEDSVERCLT